MSEQLSQSELDAIRRAFERVSARGWGVALGLLCGLGLFAATVILVVKGGPEPGPHLGLLSNYFPGFDVSFAGACIGAVYGFIGGFVGGWTVGTIYNVFVDRAS